jgi:ribose transport system permease protein
MTKSFLQNYGTVLAYVALFVFFALASDRFLSPYNLMNVLKQISYLTIIALGFTLAFITSELDLSFANIASLCSVITAGLLHAGFPIWPSVLCGLCVGIVFGLANGLLVTKLKIPSLITTLATATIANGVAFMLTGGVAYVGKLPAPFLFIGRGKIFGVSILIFWMLLVMGLILFFIKNIRTGMHMVCTGESEDAARLAGINVHGMKILGLTLSGAAAAITGVLLTSSLSSASPTMAGDFLMSGIAAVLLGMTTVEPGKANVPGTLVGALIIGTLTNGLTLVGAAYYVQDILLGLIILGSVSISASQMMNAAFGVSK